MYLYAQYNPSVVKNICIDLPSMFLLIRFVDFNISLEIESIVRNKLYFLKVIHPINYTSPVPC